MSGVSHETAFYRVAWALVAVALVAACAWGAVSVGSTLSEQPKLAASMPKATANMVQPLVADGEATSIDSELKQICHTDKTPTQMIESNDGKIIAIHC
jgi:anti-sigma-K factor RskA